MLMSTLEAQLDEQLKTAMRAKDVKTANLIR